MVRISVTRPRIRVWWPPLDSRSTVATRSASTRRFRCRTSYQHSDKAVRTVLNDMSGRAEPFVEQRDEGGSDDYYLKRGGGGVVAAVLRPEGGGDGAEE